MPQDPDLSVVTGEFLKSDPLKSDKRLGMSTHQNWVEALNISPENLSSWSAQAPSGTPLLVYCLEQGFIAIDAYFQWAQKQFEVPVLDSRFFLENFDASSLKDASAQGDWHPWQFPVENWDGVTIVACVEVPAAEDRGNYQYVLADPRAMRDVWASVNATSKIGIKALPKEEAPPEAPIGISAKPKAFTLNLDANVMDSGPMEEAAPPPPQAPAAEKTSTVSLQLETSNLFQVDPIPETSAEAPEPMTRSTVLTEVRNARREPTKEEITAIKDTFHKIGTRFQRSMILKINDMNARLVYWDDRMQVHPGDSSTNVHLQNPTFLRIVAKTAMPYHGYLMDSQAHREFFQALGYTDLPACVTAIPIKSDGNLWGMMVAIGTEANQKMDSLTFAQESTDGLVAKLGSDWIKAA